jgi:hypothetical protein
MIRIRGPHRLCVLRAHAQLSLPLAGRPSRLVPSPPTPAFDPVKSEKPIRLEPPRGWRASDARRIDLVLVIDDSGSMYGSSGDPNGVRRAAALSVVTLLERATPPRASGTRVGVVHFGSTAPTELMLPLTDIRRRRVIDDALAIPASLGGTNVAAALARSRDILTASTGRIQLVIVVTDGIEEVGAPTADELSLLPPDIVHVVLVDHGRGCDATFEARWSTLALGSFTRLDVFDTTRTAWQVADLLARSVGLSMPPLNSRPHHPPTRR